MKQYINEAKRLQKLAGIIQEAENEESLKNQIDSLRKEYYSLLTLMYGPDGTETRKAAALVKHLGNQGTFDPNRKATSPEMDKISVEEKELMGKMGTIGTKIRELYKQLEDIGLGDLVKKMQEEERNKVSELINSLTNKAIEKSKTDSENNIKTLKANQVNYINNLKKDLEIKRNKYQTDYRSWLQGDKSTPPPLPPTVK